MWGARSKRLVDPSTFPLYTSLLVINTLHIPTLVIVGLHMCGMVIMVLHILPMSNVEFYRARVEVYTDRSVYLLGSTCILCSIIYTTQLICI